LIVVSCNKKGCKDKAAFNYNDDEDVISEPSECQYLSGLVEANTTKIIVAGEIIGNTVWPKIDGVAIDYIVENTINIYGSLTIDKGVVVQFGPDGGFSIGGEGAEGAALYVEGTSLSPVIFENKPDNIRWRGIGLPTLYSVLSPRKLHLSNLKIKNAAGNYKKAAIYITDKTSIELSNVVLDGNQKYGIYIKTIELEPLFTDVVIKNYETALFTLSPNICNNLSGFTLINNTNNWFEFFSNNFTMPVNTYFNNIYPVFFKSNNYSTVTFSEFNASAGTQFLSYDYLEFNGSVNVVGTALNPVIFSSPSGQNLRNITINMQYHTNFDYTNLIGAYNSYAIRVNYNAAGFLQFTNGNLQGQQGTSLSCGIWFDGIATVPSNKYDITGTTFTNVTNNICP